MNGFDAHTPSAIGMIELSRAARGIQTADAMLKDAEVTLVMSSTNCSGKYLALGAGDVGAKLISREGLLVNLVVIPAPRDEILDELL